MPVDSYKFLPRLLAVLYQNTEEKIWSPPPWTPLPRPLQECKFGLVTTGGLYHKRLEPPFDLEREKQNPTWGDPTFRTIPTDIAQADLGISHLHINQRWIEEDMNVILPVQRFKELVTQGKIAALASQAYSFMGYQGYPPDTKGWENTYAPLVAERLKAEAVDCVFLTPG